MLPPHVLTNVAAIAVILGLVAVATFHVVRSDRGPVLFRVIVIAFIVAAAAVGVAVMF